jgi:hypothetical protein
MLLHAPFSRISPGSCNMSVEPVLFNYKTLAISWRISIPRASAVLLTHRNRDGRFDLSGQINLQFHCCLSAAICVFDLVWMFLLVPGTDPAFWQRTTTSPAVRPLRH